MSLESYYKLGSIVGVGTFGKVRLAEHMATKQKVAIKTMEKSKLIQQSLQKKVNREIWLLQKLKHQHLVRVYQAIIQDRQIHVIMEYVPGGELFDLIANRGKMCEAEARSYFQQLVSCLEYCHNRGIAHRDLKPENILLDETKRQVKVADFGLSNRMRDGRFLLTSCGSPNYAAPEVVSGKAYCGSEVDIWSLGVILYALLTGALPFDDNNLPSLFQKIREARFFMPLYLSAGAKDLITRMIQANPLNRITIPEIKNHPWYSYNLPFYLQIMDNTKSEIETEVDPVIFATICEKKEYGITPENAMEARRDILERRDVPYCIAYELLKAQEEKKQRRELLTHRVQMVFSNDNIRRLREKKGAAIIAQPAVIHSPLIPMSKAPTAETMGGTAASNAVDIASHMSVGHWFFGIQFQSHPYALLLAITDCLQTLGFKWRFDAPKYKIRCRKVIDKKYLLKYDITIYLYSTHEKLLLVDVKKMREGMTMEYFEFCAAFHDLLIKKSVSPRL